MYIAIAGNVYPRKSTGQPAIQSSAQVDELELFVCSSRETRRMKYLEVASDFSEWNVGEKIV